MAKPKLNDFKKYLSSLEEAELRPELLKLFSKLPQVQEYYAQELMSGSERKAMLDQYKSKIYNQFWTRSGNPRKPGNAKVRKLLGDFEKVSVFPFELADLLLYRVETATQFADSLGGMSEGDYSAACNAFLKAMKLITGHNLEEHFKARCEELLQYENLDYWYIDQLRQYYEEYIGGYEGQE